ADPATYDTLGQTISYSYEVKNTGNVTLSRSEARREDKSGVVNCPTGSLAPNASITCTASYAITQADLDNGSLTNHATATDRTRTSNPAEATVNADQKPALMIDKTAQEHTYAKAGDILHYSYK